MSRSFKADGMAKDLAIKLQVSSRLRSDEILPVGRPEPRHPSAPGGG